MADSREAEVNLIFQSDTLEIIGDYGLLNAFYRFPNLWWARFARVKHRGWGGWFKSNVTLLELGHALQFSDADSERLLRIHDKREQSRLMPSLVLILSLGFLFLYVESELFMRFIIDSRYELPVGSVVLLLAGSVQYAMFKVLITYFDKRYADTLCIHSLFGVLSELTASDVLQNPIRRNILLIFINALAKNTLLLPLRFTANPSNMNTAIQKHFQAMERYIREKEQQAILPDENTLNSLRKDFLMLAEIYITGNYGSFSVQESASTEVPILETGLPWYRQVIAGVVRIMGIMIPLVALYYLLSKPSLFIDLAIDPGILTLAAIAWLMISIDTAFNLGVTSKVVSLAKELKALS